MKIIIINDCDGHGRAVKYDVINMRVLLAMVIEANDVNTMMEDPEGGLALLHNVDTTAEEIELFMRDDNGPVDRSRGGMIHFVELEEVMNDVERAERPNPFY